MAPVFGDFDVRRTVGERSSGE